MYRPACLLLCLLCANLAHAQRLRTVPTEIATIQAAINASSDGDSVRVLPGRYRERISFQGRAIRVYASAGPELTILDGDYAGTVVRFDADEGRDSLLEGFTISRGRHPVHAGGVHADGASPTLRNNHIVDNVGGREGHGVSLLASAALLEGNLIAANRSVADGNGGGGGGGVGISGAGAALLVANRISHNLADRYSGGGGIRLNDAGPVWIVANTIDGNRARLQGGGISVVGRSEVRIEQNLIIDNALNEPGQGGGVQWSISYGAVGVDLIGNTLAGNQADEGSGVHADGEDARSVISNNLILGDSGASVLECGDFSDLAPPQLDHNNVVGGSQAYAGLCAKSLGQQGNLSAAPKLAPGWRLTADSPGVDAGNDGVSHVRDDLAGYPRTSDGDDDGKPHIDIGAFELQRSDAKRQPVAANAQVLRPDEAALRVITNVR